MDINRRDCGRCGKHCKPIELTAKQLADFRSQGYLVVSDESDSDGTRNKRRASRAEGFSPVSDESDSDGTRYKWKDRQSSASGNDGFSPLLGDGITSAESDAEVATDEPDGARIAAPHGKVPSRLGSSAMHCPPSAANIVATIAATCATTVDAAGADANSDQLILGAAAVSICIVLFALAMVSNTSTKWSSATSPADGERGEVTTDVVVVDNPMPMRYVAPPAPRVKRGEIPVNDDENDFGSSTINEYIEGKMFFLCSPPSRIQLADAVVRSRCIALHGLPFTSIVGTTYIDKHGVQRSYRPEDIRDDIMGQWAFITRVRPSPYPSAPALMTRAQLDAYGTKQEDDDTDVICCPAMWDPLWNVLLPTAPFTWASATYGRGTPSAANGDVQAVAVMVATASAPVVDAQQALARTEQLLSPIIITAATVFIFAVAVAMRRRPRRHGRSSRAIDQISSRLDNAQQLLYVSTNMEDSLHEELADVCLDVDENTYGPLDRDRWFRDLGVVLEARRAHRICLREVQKHANAVLRVLSRLKHMVPDHMICKQKVEVGTYVDLGGRRRHCAISHTDSVRLAQHVAFMCMIPLVESIEDTHTVRGDSTIVEYAAAIGAIAIVMTVGATVIYRKITVVDREVSAAAAANIGEVVNGVVTVVVREAPLDCSNPVHEMIRMMRTFGVSPREIASRIWDFLPSGAMAPDPVSLMHMLLQQIAMGHNVRCNYASAPLAGTSDAEGSGSGDSDEGDGSGGSSRVTKEPASGHTCALVINFDRSLAGAQSMCIKVAPSRPCATKQQAKALAAEIAIPRIQQQYPWAWNDTYVCCHVCYCRLFQRSELSIVPSGYGLGDNRITLNSMYLDPVQGPDEDPPICFGRDDVYPRFQPGNLLIDHYGGSQDGGIDVLIDDNPLVKIYEPGRACDGVAKCNGCKTPVCTLTCVGRKITCKVRDHPLYDVSDYPQIRRTMEMEIFDGADSDDEVTSMGGPVVAFPHTKLYNLPQAKDVVRWGAGYMAAVATQLPVADAARTVVRGPGVDPLVVFIMIAGIAALVLAMGAWNDGKQTYVSNGHGRSWTTHSVIGVSVRSQNRMWDSLRLVIIALGVAYSSDPSPYSHDPSWMTSGIMDAIIALCQLRHIADHTHGVSWLSLCFRKGCPRLSMKIDGTKVLDGCFCSIQCACDTVLHTGIDYPTLLVANVYFSINIPVEFPAGRESDVALHNDVARQFDDLDDEHFNEVLRPGDHVFIHGLTERTYYNTRQAVVHSVDVRWSRARLVLKDAFLDLTTATILVHVYNIRPMSEWIPVCESDGTYTTHNHAWGENRRAAVPLGAATGRAAPGSERAPYEEPWGDHFTNRTLEFLWHSYQTATPGPVRPTPVMIGPRQNPLCYLPHVCGDDNCEWAGTLRDVRTHEREVHNLTDDQHASNMADMLDRDRHGRRVSCANQQMSDGVPVPLIAARQMSTIQLAMFQTDVGGDYRPVTSQDTLPTASPAVTKHRSASALSLATANGDGAAYIRPQVLTRQSDVVDGCAHGNCVGAQPCLGAGFMDNDRGLCLQCDAVTPRHVDNDTTVFIGFSCSGCSRAASPAAAASTLLSVSLDDGTSVIAYTGPQLGQLTNCSNRDPPWVCALCITEVWGWRNACPKCNTHRPAIAEHGMNGAGSGNDGQATPSANSNIPVGTADTAAPTMGYGRCGDAQQREINSAGVALYPQVGQRADAMDLCVSAEDEVANIVSNGNVTESMDVGTSNVPPNDSAASVDAILSARQAAPCQDGAIRSPWAVSSDQRDESMDYGTPPSWCDSPSPPRTTSAMGDNACERCATTPCECTDDDCASTGQTFVATLHARRL